MTITLTDKEVEVLKLFLRLDLDAIGFESKEQRVLRSIAKKLKAVGKS